MDRNRLRAEFEQFDEAHPDVWRLFRRFAFELIHQHHAHYSSDAILHRIRWHYATSASGLTPKINNNFSAFYSRKFARLYPSRSQFFERRTSVADRVA